MALEGVVVSAGGLRVAQRGLQPAADAELRVEANAPVGLPRSAPTVARRSDGVVWRRHWLDAGRLVVEFIDLAIVEVAEDRGTIVFDRQLHPEMEQHLLFDHVLPLVLACRGEVVVHGGLISRAGRGAVLIGPSGSGKSTLTAFAWSQGWTVGGDDGAVLSPGDPPTAEPTYSTVRLTPASTELLGLGSEAHLPVVGKMRIEGDASRPFRQGPVELAMVVGIQPVGQGEEATFDELRGVDAHVLLFGSTFHAELTGQHLLPVAVARLGAIVEATTVGRLSVPRGLEGLAATERLLRTWVGEAGGSPPSPPAAPGGAAHG